ncbi:unnamed protein product [Adineta ricciae]|uniref:Apple domain-containing protein n=1 Tax=Adineta ricciae TaxID=249248 RepID=A0A815LLT6_ADIRI|nr:unnamed protein product [Adineta ricciae]CAF1405945.1 unnamed protein product [Adineta ricciae]
MKFLILLSFFTCASQLPLQNIRTIELSILYNARYQCVDPQCSPITIIFVSNFEKCHMACLDNINCRTAVFNELTDSCEIFTDIIRQYGQIINEENIVTITTIDERSLTAVLQRNWIVNGDGETGLCTSDNVILNPTDWNCNGTVTQEYYNSTYSFQFLTDPGPADRGNCHFYGQASASTTMWQTRNFTSFFHPLIDNKTIWYNFSAWIGGLNSQDDTGQVSLTFFDGSYQTIGNSITIGPVLASDRNGITSLIFRQATGLVPVGTRSFQVFVEFIRAMGTSNNGVIDNISFILYQ